MTFLSSPPRTVRGITMKLALVIPLLLLSCDAALAQSAPSTFAATTFQDGYPAFMRDAAETLGLTDWEFAVLETGVDTLVAYVGTAKQRGTPGYWAVLAQDETILANSFGWQMTQRDGFLEASVVLNIDGARGIVLPLELRVIPSARTLLYRWPTGYGEPAGVAQIQQIDKPIKVGQAMPEFGVETVDGGQISTGSLRGKTAVINWWSTACAPCIAEIPGLNTLVQKYGSRSDILFLAIAWDDREVLGDFLRERPFLYQQSVFNENAMDLFGGSFPKHVVVDEAGIVAYYAEGGSEQAHVALEEVLTQILEAEE